jgi:anti-repressor protein
MQLQEFKFNDNQIRAIEKDGEPWFVAKDVCETLGYLNTSKAISDHVEEDDRYNESLERGGTMVFINESGLYSLILRSKKPEAKTFKKWVTSEVLPQIRKTGSYSKPKSLEEISLLAITGLTAKIEEQKQALIEAQPKIEFFDVVADSKGERTIMEAAKLLKIPKPRSLYETLRLRGVLSNDNIPYQRYILDGFFRVNLTEKNGKTFSRAYVTNKGLNWLQKKFAGAK